MGCALHTHVHAVPAGREVGRLHLGSLEFLFSAYFPLLAGAWSGDLALRQSFFHSHLSGGLWPP